jgi:hypothetical protein
MVETPTVPPSSIGTKRSPKRTGTSKGNGSTENPPPPVIPPKPLAISHKTKGRKTTLTSRIFDDTPLVIAFRHIKPSWRNYIEYVDLAARNGDKEMDRYVKVWSGLTARDRNAATPEQLCEMAQIKPGELVGAVCQAIWDAKSAEGSMVSAIAHPEVLRRTAQSASKPGGQRDRELFFRVTGSLPDKKGTSVIIQNNPQTLALNGGSAGGGRVALPPGRTLHELLDMDDEVIEMGSAFAPARFLTAPVAALPIEDDSEDDDADSA